MIRILKLASLFLFSNYLLANSLQEYKSVSEFMSVILPKFHYSQLPLDRDLSYKIHDNIFSTLDANKQFFIQEEIDYFNFYKPNWHISLKKGDLQPALSILQTVHLNMIDRFDFSLNFLKDLNNFRFQDEQYILLDRSKENYAKDKEELNQIWILKVKDEFLRLKLAGKKEDDIQSLLIKRYENQKKRVFKLKDDDYLSLYFDAVARVYDPHTNYFSPSVNDSFNINISLSLEGIGATLTLDNEYVKIVSLVKAGPADKSGLVKVADRIIGVGQENSEVVDVIGWRLDDVVKLIRGAKGTKVTLEIIPASNQPGSLESKRVVIVRDAVKLEEQAAKKDILEIDGIKIGLISLPSFYMDFESYKKGDSDYRSTTKDIMKHLKDLDKEQIDGLILDLRDNGGGSLQEAVSLSDVFLGKKPVVQVRLPNNKVEILDNPLASDQKSFNKPLIVLVNRSSASASEILAGAIQDYGKGLIVGNNTFGKGTVQAVQEISYGSFLKLTTAKFYRVSGDSTQHKGVVPDIFFPETVDKTLIGEETYSNALPFDKIPSAVKYTMLDNYLISILKNKHTKRIENNPEFIYLIEKMNLNSSMKDVHLLSLNEKVRKKQVDKYNDSLLKIENDLRKAKGEQILNKLEQNTNNVLEEDPLGIEDKKEVKLTKDPYIVESGNILKDWILINNKIN